MSRRFQFSLRALMGQMTLLAVALFCLLSIGENAGPLGSACLIEASAALFGAAMGVLGGRPGLFAGWFAFLAILPALIVMELIRGIGC
jgi:hypothetical protein